jgi:hypothetical protein
MYEFSLGIELTGLNGVVRQRLSIITKAGNPPARRAQERGRIFAWTIIMAGRHKISGQYVDQNQFLVSS